MAQVAFMYLHKMILKRFIERPLLYSRLSSPLGQPVALVLVWTSLLPRAQDGEILCIFMLFLSTMSWERLCADFWNLIAPGTVFKLLYFQTLPSLPRPTGSSLRTTLRMFSPLDLEF